MRTRTFALAIGIVTFAAAAACGGSVGLEAGAGPSSTASSGGSGTSTSGLSCDVAQALSSCAECHGTTPTLGAPSSLASYADLTSPSVTDPSKTRAEESVLRMQSSTRPMPPGGGATAAQISSLESWITAGYPQQTCGTSSSSSGGASPIPNTPSVCTSGITWTRGNHGSSSMHPGRACIACHDQGEGPTYVAAGTVYPSAHEPDDCDGVGGVVVQITDANGQTGQATANSAGNFAIRSGLTPPFRVKIVSGTKERSMSGTIETADCNACHTEQGTNQAPGRIVAP